jgi:lysophospholipase L1-like esterase
MLQWHEPDRAPFRLVGFPWHAQDRVWRRLPVQGPAPLPEAVERLAACTAGGQVAFRSDSPQVAVRAELAGVADMNHMPATGQCGFDLYVGPPGAQRFVGVTKYDHRQSAYEVVLFDHPERAMRDFTLNFPLYQGVKRVHLGLAPGACLAPPPAWARAGRVVVYGTSITQGGCAARPGMAWTNILSRALQVEFVNLGFSGSGRGEPEVVRLVAAVPEPCLFVFDYEANSRLAGLEQTLLPALRTVRERHPRVPVLVLSRIAFASDLTHAAARDERDRAAGFQAHTVQALREAGDRHVHFLDGSALLGPDSDECTVDGVHPTDLGFLRIARGLEPRFRRLLGLAPGRDGQARRRP